MRYERAKTVILCGELKKENKQEDRMSEVDKKNLAENERMLGQDFMSLKAELDRIEPFYLKLLRTLGLKTWYLKVHIRWAKKKQEADGGIYDEDVLMLETFATVDREQIVNGSFVRRGR
jgi:hypothetical protein